MKTGKRLKSSGPRSASCSGWSTHPVPNRINHSCSSFTPKPALRGVTFEFSEIIRRGVSRGSRDLSLQIVWVEDCYGVGSDPDGEYVPDGGAVVRFTGLRREGADLALVEGNIHQMGSEPRGFEYVVEKKNGFWMVRSSYHQWIS